MTKKAATLAGEGVQFPSILQAAATSSDGIVRKFDSKINMSIENVTQSQQFKRWFGDWQKCRFFMFCKAAGNTPPTLLAACCGAFAVPQHGMAWLRDAQPPSGDGKMLAVEPQRFSRRSSTTNKKGRSKRNVLFYWWSRKSACRTLRPGHPQATPLRSVHEFSRRD